MNYEQKYKEALGRAKEKRDEYKRLDGEESFVPSDIEYIFPELKESEDLEEEIESYLTTNRQYAGGDEEDLWGDDNIRDAIKHGANWQKEQMMKGLCYETRVYQDEEGDGIDTPIESWLALENNEITNLPNIGLKDGDKVKVIIVKEDEK